MTDAPKITAKLAANLDASPHIVVDWRNVWRWASTRSMALAGAEVTAWTGLPADWRAACPHWAFALVVLSTLALGIIGRVIVQTPPEGESSNGANS